MNACQVVIYARVKHWLDPHTACQVVSIMTITSDRPDKCKPILGP